MTAAPRRRRPAGRAVPRPTRDPPGRGGRLKIGAGRPLLPVEMKIDRIDPSVPAASATRAVRGVSAGEPGAAALAARIGAALSSPDPAAALRVLVEEIRTELQARLRPSPPLPAPPTRPQDEDAAVALLLRQMRAAARTSPAAALSPERIRQAVLEAVDAGLSRTRALVPAAAGASGPVPAALERVVARVRSAAAALAVSPPTPRAADELPRALVREVAAALSERIGMLPARVQAPPPRDPREALARLSALFREVATDSVLAVRASDRVVELALRDGVQRALASLPPAARADPAAARLAGDLTTLALRSAAGAAPPAPRDLPSALGLMVSEFRQVLGEWAPAAASAPTSPAPPVRDLTRALSALAAVSAEALAKAPPAQVVALRAVLESASETALGRSLLQLPASAEEATIRAALEQLHLSFRGLLAAADSAATGRGLDPVGWVGLIARAGDALREDGPLPFRFDLPTVSTGSARRRAGRGVRGESVDAIESSEPPPEDALRDDVPPGPPLWPRMPST